MSVRISGSGNKYHTLPDIDTEGGDVFEGHGGNGGGIGIGAGDYVDDTEQNIGYDERDGDGGNGAEEEREDEERENDAGNDGEARVAGAGAGAAGPQLVRTSVAAGEAAQRFQQAELDAAARASARANANGIGNATTSASVSSHGWRRGRRGQRQSDRHRDRNEDGDEDEEAESLLERHRRLVLEVAALATDVAAAKRAADAADAASATGAVGGVGAASGGSAGLAGSLDPADSTLHPTDPSLASHAALIQATAALQRDLENISSDPHPAVLELIDPASAKRANSRMLIAGLHAFRDKSIAQAFSSDQSSSTSAVNAAASSSSSPGMASRVAAGFTSTFFGSASNQQQQQQQSQSPRSSETTQQGFLQNQIPFINGSAASTQQLPIAAHLQSSSTVTYELFYTPQAAADIHRTKLVELESRLTNLERIVGIQSVDPSHSVISDDYARASLFRATGSSTLIGALERIDHHLSLLAQPRTIDQATRRIQLVLADLERLTDLRKKMTADSRFMSLADGSTPAYVSGNRRSISINNNSNSDHNAASQAIAVSDEQSTSLIGDHLSTADSRIKYLYAALTRIEPISHHLPHLISRLRALQSLHADAATFSESLEAISNDQAKIKELASQTQQGMSKLLQSIKDNENVVIKNVEALDRRIDILLQRSGIGGSSAAAADSSSSSTSAPTGMS